MMPTKSRHACIVPGCPNLVESGSSRCAQHRKQENKRVDSNRPSAPRRGYDTKWREFRMQYLSVHTECAMCGREAGIIHHKKELRYGGSKYDPDNLMPLCVVCHNTLTRERTLRKQTGRV